MEYKKLKKFYYHIIFVFLERIIILHSFSTHEYSKLPQKENSNSHHGFLKFMQLDSNLYAKSEK